MNDLSGKFHYENHEVDLCVVGGGMAGICAALTAARRGAKVALMHDRPVLGGNASSECRMHISGADRHNGIPNMRETGILEELRLENLYRNPNKNYSVWDSILYEKVKFENNIELLLNCSGLDAEMDGSKIVSVNGWQLTTHTYHRVRARIFADCSGDGILAPLTGAEFRMGREAKSEFGESFAPEKADAKTMGMTCMFHSREYDSPQTFTPPSWAERYEKCEELPYGAKGHKWWEMGYWWIELGGEQHGIYDTEKLRDELLKIIYGVWDHVKNHCPETKKATENWALDWIQFLPAKRESRRFVGDHVLNQNDIEAEGIFDDVVAYGGWSMDDHHPAGFRAVKLGHPATIFHQAPSPYGIPYRCLYSKNIDNLMFAGRNASCTHMAMSSTRVMGTGCGMGQAVGIAAALAKAKNVLPREINGHIPELQQLLLRDDCYLPRISRKYSGLTLKSKLSASHGDPEPVRDGITRPVGEDQHCWTANIGDSLTYEFENQVELERVEVVLDSALDQLIAMSSLQHDNQWTSPPDVIPKKFHLEIKKNGSWKNVYEEKNNYQRQVVIKGNWKTNGIRLIIDETWGAKKSKVYAFTVK